MQTICRIAILVASVLLVIDSVIPLEFGILTGIIGLIVVLSGMTALGSSFKKPTYIFLGLSLLLLLKYELSLSVIVNGINSMLAVASIVAVLQLFGIPIRVGNYDVSLERYLRMNFKKETSLFVFLNLVSHLLGSFMLFGTIPMLYTIFDEPLQKMVRDSKRFLGTAIGRSYSLVTLWAPGTVSVVLVMEITGAGWLDILLPCIGLALIGLLTTIVLEVKSRLKNHDVLSVETDSAEGSGNGREDKKKILILVLIAVLLIASIVLMEMYHILTGSTRVIAAGFVISLVWILKYMGKPGLSPAWRAYWDKSIFVARDLAVLFLAMGIFTEAVSQAGLISYLQAGLVRGADLLGQYTFLLIPPLVIALSLVGIHPFVSCLLIGKMLVLSIPIPGYEVYIAISLLLGSAISYMISPLAGNVLTISRMAGVTSREVGYTWNGLYCLLFLLEGFIFLLALQMF